MKKPELHNADRGMEELLRQFMLEDESHDLFTEKLIDMNAAFIFGQPAAVIPAPAKENALLQQLGEVLLRNSSRRTRGWWWLGALLLVIIAGGILLFNRSFVVPEATVTTTIQPQPSSPSVAPLITDTSKEKTADALPVVQNETIVADDSIAPADSVPATKASYENNFTITHDGIRMNEDWFAGSDTYVADVPGPVLTTKATPENFKVANGNFNVDTAHFLAAMYKPQQPVVHAVYYSGEPFKSGLSDMVYFNLGQYAQGNQEEQLAGNAWKSHAFNPWQLPWSVMEYCDSSDVSIGYSKAASGAAVPFLSVKKFPENGIRLSLEPFYFRKYEVTNAEYREFLQWVRAANGYGNKPIISTTIDTLPPGSKGKPGSVVIPGKMYDLQYTITRTEDYHEVFNYIFFDANNEAVTRLGKKSLYVMPDTLTWVNDFTFSYNEPMTNMYRWHPAYDNYPVVGVSWFQAMAFLDWKTHFHQQQLDAANVPYEITYSLPSDIEWELASTAEPDRPQPGFAPQNVFTNDWITNTAFYFPLHDDPYQRPNYLKDMLTHGQNTRGNYVEDGYFHTGPADLTHLSSNQYQPNTPKHIDNLGISWMDGNVSEWMIESYSENWLPFFTKHLAVLDAMPEESRESVQLAKQIEMLYDKGNARNGKLVRGANWYDERFGSRLNIGRNEQGIAPKRYIDPNEQHCTIGFRYVVHVKYKNEAERIR